MLEGRKRIRRSGSLRFFVLGHKGQHLNRILFQLNRERTTKTAVVPCRSGTRTMNHAWTGKLVPNKSKRGPSWKERCRLTTDKETNRDGGGEAMHRLEGERRGRERDRSPPSPPPLPARVNAGKNGDSANVFRGCARSLFSDN